MMFKSFCIGTCEGGGRAERRLPFTPRADATFAPFEVSDPFGLRRAIVPVFRRDSQGWIYGMGTAFHVEGWDAFLTTQHVVDFVGAHEPLGLVPGRLLELDAKGDQPILYLGLNGVVFGQVDVPDEAFASVAEVIYPMQENDDPLAKLQGRSAIEAVADVAVMRAKYHPRASLPHTLRVRGSAWTPTIGEYVLAAGYATLNCQVLDENERRALLEEGMYGAYARVTGVHPNGRNSSHPTPVFEVEGDWRSGMSGGPVFDSNGEVVGLVSRSLPPDGTNSGIGWAVDLPYLRDVVNSLRHRT